MRFVHVSDLHYSGTPDEERVLLALTKDLARANAQREIDALFFTGDLVSKGNFKGVVPEALNERTIGRMREAAGGKVEVVVCPGNHDINLTARGPVYSPVFQNVSIP